jgi:hypothetical protein
VWVVGRVDGGLREARGEGGMGMGYWGFDGGGVVVLGLE